MMGSVDANDNDESTQASQATFFFSPGAQARYGLNDLNSHVVDLVKDPSVVRENRFAARIFSKIPLTRSELPASLFHPQEAICRPAVTSACFPPT